MPKKYALLTIHTPVKTILLLVMIRVDVGCNSRGAVPLTHIPQQYAGSTEYLQLTASREPESVANKGVQ